MTTAVRDFLKSFDSLSESDKRELVAEIMRRSISFDYPSLSDIDLVMNAEDLFLELEKKESIDAPTTTRRSLVG